ncbi:hypothetical protein SAMN05421630_103228 [Prauserella marina]|uniref:Uncharacterized protein n=1 Tax=Prauserella marina TaxID=530584 RepID=A0A1G6NNA2_9PSEU|nr:hypothetical protein DES30_102692 [Prauserella marina]SDC69472.1 hypothetical protein SAMN05421630_103228 [Prauserella marina]
MGLIALVIAILGVAGLANQRSTDNVQTQSGTSWTTGGIEYRTIKSEVSVSCNGHAYGQTSRFLSERPCTRLARSLFYGETQQRAKAAISVSWTTMPTSTTAHQLRQLIDRDGTGNLDELTDGTTFTGLYYASKVDHNTVVIAQAEGVNGALSPRELKHMAVSALTAQQP